MGKISLSNAEADIMEIIWNSYTNLTFTELLQTLNTTKEKEVQRQTLRTQIVRLIDKGILICNKDNKHILYSATMTKVQYIKFCASELLTDLFDGSIRNFIVALSGGEKLDEKTISELRKYLEE